MRTRAAASASLIVVLAVALLATGCSEPDKAEARGRPRVSKSPSPTSPMDTGYVSAPPAGMWWISPAAKKAAEEVGFDLKAEARKVHKRVNKYLEYTLPDIHIKARPGRRSLIATGGEAESYTGFIYIEIYPEFHGDFEKQLPFDFRNTLAHELNHSARIWNGGIYGRTLLDGFIGEGLAEAFTLEMYPKAELLSESAITPEEEASLWELAQPLLDKRLTKKMHDRWFFGRYDLPNATGYALGLRIVQAYLKRHPKEEAHDITLMRAEKIYKRSGYKP
jgi:uncharacterized protein YjaZ